MTSRRLAAVLVVMLACGTAVPVGAVGATPPTDGASSGVVDPTAAPSAAATTTTPEATGTAHLVAAYPNPVARGDPGEFVVVRSDRPTDATGWSLTDGKTTARLPERTLEGAVALATDPAEARAHTDHRVVELEGRHLLADGDNRLELVAGGRVVDRARYRNAPESSVRDFRERRWRPVGATDLEPARTVGARRRCSSSRTRPTAPSNASGVSTSGSSSRATR